MQMLLLMFEDHGLAQASWISSGGSKDISPDHPPPLPVFSFDQTTQDKDAKAVISMVSFSVPLDSKGIRLNAVNLMLINMTSAPIKMRLDRLRLEADNGLIFDLPAGAYQTLPGGGDRGMAVSYQWT